MNVGKGNPYNRSCSIPCKEKPYEAKIILLDNDMFFRTLLVALSSHYNVKVDCYSSLIEMHSFAHLRNYDLVIVDRYLENVSGIEIAEYVDTFFPDLPVILISENDLEKTRENWPQSIRGSVSKNQGPGLIMQTALKELRKIEFYKTLQAPAHLGRNLGQQASGILATH